MTYLQFLSLKLLFFNEGEALDSYLGNNNKVLMLKRYLICGKLIVNSADALGAQEILLHMNFAANRLGMFKAVFYGHCLLRFYVNCFINSSTLRFL